MTHAPDRLREALAERYELGDELGRGGMAVVFRARDSRHDRDVAIKVLRPGILSTSGAARFLQEIQIQARLQHPNVLPLYDSGEIEGILYYVMPCVTGESLRQRLAREGQLPVADALQIAREVADALSYAHSQGVVHRDIKPSNILLSSRHAIVSDFGIARALSKAAGDRLTDSGLVVGTPEYMSPEQASGDEQIDARTDIYALGCVLFEMLTGEPPYTGRTPQAIIAKHVLERLPSLEVVRPGVPSHVIKTVETCLAKAPADRFESAQQFLEALDKPAVEPGAGRRLRWKVAAGIGVLATLVAIVTWLAIRPPAVTLDARKIVVFPLEEHGLSASETGAGYDVALMIELALDHSEPLRWIDGRKWLHAPIRDDIGQLTPRLALEVSRGRRSGYYIDGVVRRGRDSATAVVQLHDVAGDTLYARESASAAYGELSYAQLGLQAVRKLLPALLASGREVDLTALTDRSPAAIALWLQGEREYRRVQFRRAVEFYERALAEDSALAFAAIKGAQSANWYHESEQAETLVTVALSQDSLLPSRYGHFARGLQGYLSGEADSAVAHFEQALAEAPDWPEASMALGEVFYHLLPSRAPLDSLAEASFQRALASDSAFAPALFHLTEIAIRRGELARASELLSRFERVNPELSLGHQLDVMFRCVANRGVDWHAEASSDALVALFAAASLSVGGYQSACAEQGFRAVLSAGNSGAGERWGAFLGLQGLLVAQGRDREAAALIDSAVAGGTQFAVLLHLVDMLAGAKLQQEAAKADSFLMQRYGADYRGARSPAYLWLFGVWHAHRGDLPRVVAIDEELGMRATAGGDRRAQPYSEALAAHLPYLRGDTAEAIDRLRKITPSLPHETLDWGVLQPLPYEPLRLAELLLARGQYKEAYQVASVFDHPTPIIYLPFVPASLAIRYQAAQAMNRSDLASKNRARLLSLGRTDLVEGNP